MKLSPSIFLLSKGKPELNLLQIGFIFNLFGQHSSLSSEELTINCFIHWL